MQKQKLQKLQARKLQRRNLLKVLSEESRELPVILDPDANVPIENVLDVHDAARNVRFSHVQFAVPK